MQEEVKSVVCGLENPSILSHHDAVLSVIRLEASLYSRPENKFPPAPRVNFQELKCCGTNMVFNITKI